MRRPFSKSTLVMRGLWWRRGLNGALLGVAVLTTTAAALGPMYARAASESILQDHLMQATWTAGIAERATVDVGRPGAYSRAHARALKPGALLGYGSQVRGFYTPYGLTAAAGANLSGLKTHLVWKESDCKHVVILRGRCPSRANEAMMSDRTAASGVYGSEPGSIVYLGSIANPNDPNYFTTSHPPPPPVRIVGVYRPISAADPFWFGQGYFTAGPDGIDSLLVAEAEFQSLPRNTYVEADFDYPLSPGRVRLTDVPAERTAISRLLATHTLLDGISASTSMLRVLDAAANEEQIVNVATLLVTLQLAFLAWLVLFQVAADAIGARGDEIAISKLRGHSLSATMRFAFGEPTVMLTAAVPLGIVVAFALTHALADAAFVPGVPVIVTAAPLLTAGLAWAGGISAVALAGQQTVTRSVLDQWRRTTRRPGHGALLLAIDIVLAVAAAIGVTVLLTARAAGGENDTAALLVPGLLVFAIAIVGVRLLPLGCRWLVQMTRGSRRLAVFLAACQVARRPVGLRLAALLAVAAGLAAFAVAGESIASANRNLRAQAEVGAPRVAAVQFAAGVDPIAATHRADPKGKWAMMAATWLPDGGDSFVGTVLGVDASRLGVVGYSLSGGLPTTTISAALAPPVAPIEITGRKVRLHLRSHNLTGNARPDLQINFRTSEQAYVNAEGSSVREGTHAYVVPVDCSHKCLLRGLTWDRPISARGRLTGSIRVLGIDVWIGHRWKPLNIGLGIPHSWHTATPQGQASDEVTISSNGIRDAFTNANGGYGGITYSSDPSPMPAVATPTTAAAAQAAPHPDKILDPLNTVAYFKVVRTTPVLPVVLNFGAMMDLPSLQDELPGFASEANWQVWLGPNAPANALSRLARVGLQPQAVHSTAGRVAQLSRQAPALAFLLLLVCAVAGAALAAGGTATSITASRQRRTYEVAALRVVGVSRRSLLRASMAEQLLLLGGSVLLGVPAGLLAAVVAMPAIPEFAHPTPVKLHYIPHPLPTGIFVAAFAALVLATAFVAAEALIRSAVPARLRAAE